jgi:hypothetical protein
MPRRTSSRRSSSWRKAWRTASPLLGALCVLGQPQIADPQSMIFSPPFLLLALFNSAPSLWAD